MLVPDDRPPLDEDRRRTSRCRRLARGQPDHASPSSRAARHRVGRRARRARHQMATWRLSCFLQGVVTIEEPGERLQRPENCWNVTVSSGGACKQQGLRHASSRCVGNLGNAAHYLLALAEDRSAVLAPGNRPFGTRVGPPKSPVPLRSGAPTPLEAESRLPFSASSVPPRVRRNRLARAKKKARASRPFEVGGTGLEPVTPSLSSWCSPN